MLLWHRNDYDNYDIDALRKVSTNNRGKNGRNSALHWTRNWWPKGMDKVRPFVGLLVPDVVMNLKQQLDEAEIDVKNY